MPSDEEDEHLFRRLERGQVISPPRYPRLFPHPAPPCLFPHLPGSPLCSCSTTMSVNAWLRQVSTSSFKIMPPRLMRCELGTTSFISWESLRKVWTVIGWCEQRHGQSEWANDGMNCTPHPARDLNRLRCNSGPNV